LLLDLISNVQGWQSLDDEGSYNTQAALERSVRRIQLPAGRTLLLDELRRWAALATSDVELSHEKQRIVRDAVIAAPILKQWSDLLGTLPTKATLAEWVAHWKTVLTTFGIIHKSSETHWQLFETALATIQTTDARLGVAEEQLNSRSFLELWQTVADAVPLPSSTENVGRVRVLSAESARNLAAKHVFLAGLSEQSFSSIESTGRLYSEHEITRFGTEVSTAEQIAAQQTGESMLLFYDVLTRASDTLTLSYAALDDKGQALSPSPFVIELERAFEPARISTVTMPPGELVSEEKPPLSQSEWRTTSTAAALVGEHAWLAGLLNPPPGYSWVGLGEGKSRNLGRAILRGIHCVASRSKRETFGPYEGLLTSPVAHAAIARRFNSEHLWSPSQLETYAACPYQFFAKQILHLEPLTELTLRSDHLRRGTLLHQVLAAVHDQQEDFEMSLTSEYLIERFTSALQQAIEGTPLRGLEEALREIERREILAWAPQYAEQELNYRGQWQNFEEPFAPAHFEVRFGPKARGEAVNDAVSTLIPFTLDLGTEQIKLTGQIDRVDMGRIHGVTVFNIIDYKSGQEVRLTDDEIISGRQLQLPLYALAAEQLLFADQQAVALATGYWSIKSTGFASGGRSMLEFRTSADHGLTTSERWTGLNEVILDRVKEIIKGIRSAEFPVYNENKECTRYCDFSKICRIAQIRSLEKVWYPTTPDEQPPT
jgi:RecB family exonuclease